MRDINERICIASEPLPECSAQRAVSEVETAIRSLDPPRPTFFEALFASALVHFRNARAHPVVIETGLGPLILPNTACVLYDPEPSLVSLPKRRWRT